MTRYSFYRFDTNTYVVFDRDEQREICVCSNYGELSDAEHRAQTIATLLNQNDADLVKS